MAVMNVNVPLAAIERLSPPLSCKTSPVPSSPTTFPPMETVPVEHVTCTPVTLAVAVPLPLATVQVCAGVEGAVRTETLYGIPVAILVVNVKGPAAAMARLFPPLSSKTSPVPARPVTVPPMVKVPEPEPEPVLVVDLPGKLLQPVKKR